VLWVEAGNLEIEVNFGLGWHSLPLPVVDHWRNRTRRIWRRSVFFLALDVSARLSSGIVNHALCLYLAINR